MNNGETSDNSVLYWRITWRIDAEGATPLPKGIVTVPASFSDGDMPPEIALLLPTNDGPSAFINHITRAQRWDATTAVGLFMSDPFLSAEREARQLREFGVAWIANLPTIEQQDQEFTQQLADVGLDHIREIEMISAFKSAGFKIAVVASNAEGAAAAARIAPDAVIVLPRVSDFAAGFPSPRQRSAIAQSVRDVLIESGWSGPVIGYGDAREAAHDSQWPDAVDGMLCRPMTRPLDDLSR